MRGAELTNPFAALSGYELRHLSAHLVAAGRDTTLHRMLALERGGESGARNLWFEVHDAAGDIAGFSADIARAWDAAEGTSDVALEIHYALVAASLTTLAEHMPNSLRAAMLRGGVWTAERALADARGLWAPGERAEALAVLLPDLPVPLRRDVIRETLALTRQDRAAYVVAMLLPYVDEDEGERPSKEAREWASGELDKPPDLRPAPATDRSDVGGRAAMVAVAEDLLRSEEMPEKVKTDIRTMLAAQLPDRDPDRAVVQTLRAIERLSWLERRAVLDRLAPYLSPSLLADAAALARRLEDAANLDASAAWLGPYLRAEVAERLATTISRLPESEDRTLGLAVLAPYRSHGDVREAMETLIAIEPESNEIERIRGLTLLARHLNHSDRNQALFEALASANALFSEQHRAECTAIVAAEIQNADDRAATFHEALEIARSGTHRGLQALALVHLIPWLDEGDRDAVLTEAEARITGPDRLDDLKQSFWADTADLEKHPYEDSLDELVLAHLGAWRAVALPAADKVTAIRTVAGVVERLGRVSVLTSAYIERPSALMATAPLLASLPPPEAHGLWTEALRALARRPRTDLTPGIVALMPGVATLAGAAAADATVESVLRVQEWWP